MGETCAHGVVLVEGPDGLRPSDNCMECLREQIEIQQRCINDLYDTIRCLREGRD